MCRTKHAKKGEENIIRGYFMGMDEAELTIGWEKNKAGEPRLGRRPQWGDENHHSARQMNTRIQGKQEETRQSETVCLTKPLKSPNRKVFHSQKSKVGKGRGKREEGEALGENTKRGR